MIKLWDLFYWYIGISLKVSSQARGISLKQQGVVVLSLLGVLVSDRFYPIIFLSK